MRTIENYHPAPNSTSGEFHSSVVAPRSEEDQPGEQKFSLVDAFGAIENAETEITAMKIIDRMKFGKENSPALYFYHLWQENPQQALIRIKRLTKEVREDEVERVVHRVTDNDHLTEQYGIFYKRYIRATERFRRNDFVQSIRENLTVEEAAQEAEIKQSNAIVIKSQLDKKPKEITLWESLGGKTLTPTEERAVLAIDVLNIPIRDKQVLFAAQLFFGREGVIRARDQFGFSINKTVDARDKIRTNDRYEALWRKLEFLMQPNVVEVARLKKTGVTSNKKIAESLGIDIKTVNEISKTLVLAELVDPSPRGKHNAVKAKERRRKLLASRSRNGKGLSQTNPKLAASFGMSQALLEQVVRRAGRFGDIEKKLSQKGKTPEEIKNRRKSVKELWTTTNLTQEQIANQLGVTKGEVRYDLIVLRRRKEVLPR